MKYCHCFAIQHLNTLWPSDPIWWHTSDSILVQVMACYLTAPSHYLDQCWLLINKLHWHSLERTFTMSALAIFPYNVSGNYTFKIFASPRVQWPVWYKSFLLSGLNHSDYTRKISRGLQSSFKIPICSTVIYYLYIYLSQSYAGTCTMTVSKVTRCGLVTHMCWQPDSL